MAGQMATALDQAKQLGLAQEPTVGDFIALMKPRVMSLVVFTALVGLVAAPGTLHPVLACIALLAITVGAGASGALNMWYDADIDRKMQRTVARPIPRGKVTEDEALTFGAILSVFSVLTLGVLVNWVAGGLLALTIGFYLFVYTMWLKRRTPQNIWALALYRCRDYERGGVPMLPVVAGPQETRKQILIYSVLLVAISLAPFATGLGGLIYVISAALSGAVFLWLAWKVYVTTEGREADQVAKRLFVYSIFYLFALFAVILAEHTVKHLFGVML